MKKLKDLKAFDHIAFGFNFNGGKPNEIVVTNITTVETSTEDVLVHFLYGYQSLAEYIKLTNIIAIGNNDNGQHSMPGWSGKFDIVNQELLNTILET